MAGKIADQKDDGVAEVLKMLELAQQHRVAEMQVGRGRIKAGFDAQRLAGRAGFLQLGGQLGFFDDLRRAFLDVGELLFNRSERRHKRTIIAAKSRRDSRPRLSGRALSSAVLFFLAMDL